MALQAGTVLEFSIDSATTAYGVIQSVNVTDTTERATARGSAGATVSTQEFDPTTSFTMNILMLGTPVGPPAIGTAFTYDGTEYQLDTVEDGRTVDEFQTYDIAGISYPSATVN
jgi:hypothetical protein